MENTKNRNCYTFRIIIRKNDQETVMDACRAATPEEAERAKAAIAAIKAILDSFVPILEGPATPDAAPALPEPTPEPATPPVKRKTPRGAMFLKCPSCGRTFGTFVKEPADTIDCRCGNKIPISGTGVLGHYTYTCPCCETRKFGWTNLQDAEIEMKCRCGNAVSLTWNPTAREYR